MWAGWGCIWEGLGTGEDVRKQVERKQESRDLKQETCNDFKHYIR